MTLRCRIGWHDWYLDAGIRWSVHRCNRCGKPRSAFAAGFLDQERAWLREGRTAIDATTGQLVSCRAYYARR